MIDLDDIEEHCFERQKEGFSFPANITCDDVLALIQAVRCAQKYVGPHWSTYGELESPLHELKESLQPFRAEVKG